MNIEEIRTYCLSKKGTDEGFPFDETTLVIKVGGKIFILLNLSGSPSMNLKCEPLWAIDLRETYPAIIPGYHMNKKHWNTVILDSSISVRLLKKMIDHSYDLVLTSLPVKQQFQINQNN